ncbi:two-component system, cell cycle response regulator DivK [Verrucomicrobium sp. GAS474]|uniref:response regulator n=1 Tax=Verrucomicrobium sp. GAS474 TaxID=1882831 RepID=UPI00087B377E|nr:response regulator [Verrucomicrobium sp. GAS474]SDT97056.1 two-component system, cell cycle response regulator DivK [Verrucomicrobium sp. GAS474]
MSAAHVLVVEDNEMNFKLAQRLLEIEGYRVSHAPDAESALVQIREQIPDLIALDIQLPEMDGFTFAEIIKKDAATRDIPILALSAHAMQEDVLRAKAIGIDGYITKPIDTRKFPEQVASCLAKRKKASEAASENPAPPAP